MAIKKSDLYSSLWASCDELRGGMDASQYKDYVLFILFIKYITDKYANSSDFAPPVTIPAGASFKDMLEPTPPRSLVRRRRSQSEVRRAPTHRGVPRRPHVASRQFVNQLRVEYWPRQGSD